MTTPAPFERSRGLATHRDHSHLVGPVLATTGRMKLNHGLICAALGVALGACGGEEATLDTAAQPVLINTDFEQGIVSYAKFRDLCLWLYFCFREVATLRLGDILRLGDASTELHGDIAIPINFATGDDLIAFQRKNGHGNMTTIFIEDACHPNLLRDHASAHDLLLLKTEAHGDPFPAGLINPKFE